MDSIAVSFTPLILRRSIKSLFIPFASHRTVSFCAIFKNYILFNGLHTAHEIRSNLTYEIVREIGADYRRRIAKKARAVCALVFGFS